MELEVYKRQRTRCACCGGRRIVFTGEVADSERTVAVFWAFLYDHPEGPEVFLDATFGTWGTSEYTDHVSFGSRTGPIEVPPHIASSLVTGAEMAPDDAMYGEKLTREEALAHPMLEDFWVINDMVLVGIPEIDEHLNGGLSRRRWFTRK